LSYYTESNGGDLTGSSEIAVSTPLKTANIYPQILKKYLMPMTDIAKCDS